MEEKKTRKIIFQDIVISAAFVMHFLALVSTNFIVVSLEAMDIAAKQLEIDPIMRWAMNFNYIQFGIISVAYGLLIAMYIYTRRHYLKGSIDALYLNAFVFIIFYMYTRDFMGNFGVWLKIIALLGGG